MTSRRWLIKLMKQAAERKNITFESIRQRGSHEIFQLDGLMIPIPRHNEIDNDLANIIVRKQKPNSGKAGISSENISGHRSPWRKILDS